MKYDIKVSDIVMELQKIGILDAAVNLSTLENGTMKIIVHGTYTIPGEMPQRDEEREFLLELARLVLGASESKEEGEPISQTDLTNAAHAARSFLFDDMVKGNA